MRILDRERYWAFFKAYVICFVALVGLYVVIDAFSNLDEFNKRAETASEMFKVMGRYYLVHMTQFYDRLCGVIGMMAAIFTVTWMQRNNELLAMLAAGISTQRVIRPVWGATIIVSLIAVLNQELLIPPLAEELQKSHDDDGSRKVPVSSRFDTRGVLIHGVEADRRTKTVMQCNVTLPVDMFGTLRELAAKQARYIPPDALNVPRKGGWLLRGAHISPALEPEEYENSPLTRLTSLKGFPPPFGDVADLGGESYFLESDLTFENVARIREWYMYATTGALIRNISDASNDKSEKTEIGVFLHVRVLRPLASLSLMMLSLPLVLGGYGGNMFVNLGMSLGTSAVFYGACFLSQYLGDHSVLSPELSAWAPLMGFGSVAVMRWGSIRT